MGGKQSSSLAPVFDQPWREINWSNKQEMLHYVKTYKPYKEDQTIKILLHGQVGAGKSSYINSIHSVLRGRMVVEALAENSSMDCFTKKLKSYRFPKENQGTSYPFIFTDIMGLKPDNGILENDIKLVLEGHVKDEYAFNPESSISVNDRFYNENPTGNDKFHVLVCVVAANTVTTMSDEIIKKIRTVRLEASRLGIPQVAVLTKVDLACPEVGDNLKNVYKSKHLKTMMEQFSVNVGIPMNCIFPVKNYHEETNLRDEVDVLILDALKHIIHFGDDFVNRYIKK